MKKLTIKDIARMAGVSTTVVSFVMNDKPGVSPATRKKVKEVIELTQFKPNLSSQRLILKKSFNISLLSEKTSNPFNDFFYFEVAQGIQEKSCEYGYNIVFSDLTPNNGSLSYLPNAFVNSDADGVIIFQKAEKSIIDYIFSREIPAIMIDSHSKDFPFPSIDIDYTVSAYTATNHLIEMGHREIAFMSSSFNPEFYSQVFNGFNSALAESGVFINPNWIFLNIIDEESAYKTMQGIIDSKKLPSAIFCSTDMFAIEAMRCAMDNNLKIPDDISFIGIDDIIISKYVNPPLTTVQIDKKKMGILAMDMIVNEIEHKNSQSISLPANVLIKRKSVKKIH